MMHILFTTGKRLSIHRSRCFSSLYVRIIAVMLGFVFDMYAQLY